MVRSRALHKCRPDGLAAPLCETPSQGPGLAVRSAPDGPARTLPHASAAARLSVEDEAVREPKAAPVSADLSSVDLDWALMGGLRVAHPVDGWPDDCLGGWLPPA